ncbi:DUF4239 domain-containing protein [Amycolatopsis sp. NPDC059021]|uniref:bestrophin-like domain n=1 Tax=Amycolatopsis sp. NPDC059021 TaxID=3346704 RepID=UPI00367139CD
MLLWIYDVPNWLLFLIIVSGTLAVGWVAVCVLRPVMGRLFGDRDERNTMVDLVLTGTGLFYGLLLGLIAAAAYTTFSEAQATADKEASTVAALYRDASAYPEPVRSVLRGQLEEYVDYVIDEAWPQQRRGQVPTGGIEKATAILNTLATFQPANPGQAAFHSETLRQYNNFVEARRARLTAVTAGLPPSLWWVLIIGALINLVLMSMLGVRRLLAHLLVAGLFAIFVGMMLFLIVSLDNPFLGHYSVDSSGLELLRDTVLRR